MNMIKAGIVAALIFGVMDAVWLKVIVRSLYKSQAGILLRPQPNWWMTACVYLLMIAGFVWFVFPQVQMTRSILQALQYGARFGVILYGVYECTNYAALAEWPLQLVVIDTLWGGLLYAMASAAVFYLRNWI